MDNVFADVDTHAVLSMEDKELKTYRQKIMAEKQQHDWEMRLLEKERRLAWNSDRVEQSRLISRMENINKRIQEINKENSRKQRQAMRTLLSDPKLPLQGECTDKKSSKKSDKNENITALAGMPFLSSTWLGGMGYQDVFQDSQGGTQKQGGLKLDLDAKPFKSPATSIPEHPSIQQTRYHIPVVAETSSRLEAKNKDASPQKLPSKNKTKHVVHKRATETTDEEVKAVPVKPRLPRRQSMDPKLLASILNVDEYSVQKQNQVFQRARLNSDVALRIIAAETQENPEGNEKKTTNKKASSKLQRRASVESMHMSSDLLKIGFPDWKARERMFPITWPNTKQSPTGCSFVSRERRNSLPSVSSTTHGKFTKLGSTAPRRKRIVSTLNMKTTSLDKLENVVEESEEHSHKLEREATMKNLIQNAYRFVMWTDETLDGNTTVSNTLIAQGENMTVYCWLIDPTDDTPEKRQSLFNAASLGQAPSLTIYNRTWAHTFHFPALNESNSTVTHWELTISIIEISYQEPILHWLLGDRLPAPPVLWERDTEQLVITKSPCSPDVAVLGVAENFTSTGVVLAVTYHHFRDNYTKWFNLTQNPSLCDITTDCSSLRLVDMVLTNRHLLLLTNQGLFVSSDLTGWDSLAQVQFLSTPINNLMSDVFQAGNVSRASTRLWNTPECESVTPGHTPADHVIITHHPPVGSETNNTSYYSTAPYTTWRTLVPQDPANSGAVVVSAAYDIQKDNFVILKQSQMLSNV
ncbi:CATSPERB [Branchiostoma lanceolatum]|uniref:CATSPERB protein n=1 Tax=Branchiostoma lanceolatum TaxID=7740 RepID=A0A8K0A8B9_BRALA|nr:CATSPERB [Branchiostoma lanceolatum]